MAQTVKSTWVLSGWRVVLLEKPQVLRRTFFDIRVLADPATDSKSYISFDDPSFLSYYTLDGSVRRLKAKGEGIFQGAIWVSNVSTTDLLFVMTEILI